MEQEQQDGAKSHCIESVFTDKRIYKITLEYLDRFWEKALKEKKLPLLTLGIQRNEKQMFVLECKISLQEKGKK